MAKTFAQTVADAQLMKAALKSNLKTLANRGMTQEFIDAFGNSLSSLTAKDVEQEKLKADLHTVTAAMDELSQQLNAQMQEAVKVVKLEMPKERWKEFGIKAKR
jgi:vancomycin resistance protein YoaR